MLPEHLDIQVIKNTGHQYQTVKKQMYRKEIGQIIIATDAGREGELVARWIIHKSVFNKPLNRFFISSVTYKAIRHVFTNLKFASYYQKLF